MFMCSHQHAGRCWLAGRCTLEHTQMPHLAFVLGSHKGCVLAGMVPPYIPTDCTVLCVDELLAHGFLEGTVFIPFSPSR